MPPCVASITEEHGPGIRRLWGAADLARHIAGLAEVLWLNRRVHKKRIRLQTGGDPPEASSSTVNKDGCTEGPNRFNHQDLVRANNGPGGGKGGR